MSLDPDLWRIAVDRIDVSDGRRTAESVLAIEPDGLSDVIAELAKVKRLSIVMRNLNRLMDSPADRELGRRALRHLGFLDD
jgi:putative heme iron utilization protein